MNGQPVPACEVRRGDLLAYDGRELLVIRTAGTWYREQGRPVAGLAIECRSGSARWTLYRARQRAPEDACEPVKESPEGPGGPLTSADPGPARGLSHPGPHRGWYQALVQPFLAYLTVRCPLPGCLRAAGQSHGCQLTITRPGPHACPAWHCSGHGHQAGRRTFTSSIRT